MTQYVLIPQLESQPDESIIQLITLDSQAEVRDFISCIQPDELAALDLETRGLYPRYHRDQMDEHGTPWFSSIVAYGLHAESIGSVCVDLRNSFDGCALALTNEILRVRPKLIGHNAYFDWMQLAALYNPPQGYEWQDLPWHDDTYILFKLLATEGWVGQRHGLKEAQQSILGWFLRGDAELSEWLKANKLKKGDMWQAPFEILGRYCALDCQSTFLLYKHLKGIADRWKAFEVLRPAFMSEIRCLIQNYFSGVPVDREKLTAFTLALEPQIEEATRKVFSVPEVKAHVDSLYAACLQAHPEPRKFTQRPLVEPPKFKKDGKVTARWLKWQAKMEQYVPPEPSKTWLRWEKNMRELDEGMKRWGCAPELFNLESPKQMLHLVYTVLNLDPVWTKDKAAAKKGIKQDKLDTSKGAYGSWGDFGKAVAERAKLVQRHAMSTSWLSNTDPSTGLLHPLFKVMGTTTTRLSGSGGVNVQNPVKDKEFLDCIREKHPDEWVWVNADFVALESVLMAFVSQDEGYLSIYGPDAKPEDIYLFFGGHIPGIKEKLAESGYYPRCADKDAIKRAKKEHKELRGVAKAAVLAFAYGCGKKTFYINMTNKKVKVDGKPLARAMCDTIFDTYWNTFKGLKAFNEWCEATWERTGGYVLSPIGLPVAACSDKVHKTPNHCIQMLGHCMCMLWLMFVEQEMDASGREWYPVIWDFHDETSLRVKCAGEDRQKVIDESIAALKRACDRLNAVVCLTGKEIPMKVDGASGTALTAFKIEE